MIKKNKLSFTLLNEIDASISCTFVSEDWIGYNIYYIMNKSNEYSISLAIWNIEAEQATIYCIETIHNFIGKGYGTKLIKEIENDCIKNNVKFLKVRSLKQSVKFYEKLGFKKKQDLEFCVDMVKEL